MPGFNKTLEELERVLERQIRKGERLAASAQNPAPQPLVEEFLASRPLLRASAAFAAAAFETVEGEPHVAPSGWFAPPQ